MNFQDMNQDTLKMLIKMIYFLKMFGQDKFSQHFQKLYMMCSQNLTQLPQFKKFQFSMLFLKSLRLLYINQLQLLFNNKLLSMFNSLFTQSNSHNKLFTRLLNKYTLNLLTLLKLPFILHTSDHLGADSLHQLQH